MKTRRNLARKPQVGPEGPTSNNPARDEVDSDSQRTRANMDTCLGIETSKRSMDCGGVDPTQGGDAGSGVPEGDIDLHVYQCRTNCVIHKGGDHENSEIALSALSMHHKDMARPRKSRAADPWKQRDRFMELVDQKVASGTPMPEIAKALGLRTTSSLDTAYRYDHRRIPKRPTIERAAAYFGVSQSEIYGDTDSQAMSPAKRLVHRSITKTLRDPHISDETAEKIWNAIELLIEEGKIPKPQ